MNKLVNSAYFQGFLTGVVVGEGAMFCLNQHWYVGISFLVMAVTLILVDRSLGYHYK